jgi:hypothetical protein
VHGLTHPLKRVHSDGDVIVIVIVDGDGDGDGRQRQSLVSIGTTRASNSIPRRLPPRSITSTTCNTSIIAAHSIADPRAIA